MRFGMRIGGRAGALSLVALLGGVNAACMNFRPAPQPLSRELAGDPPAERWSLDLGRPMTGMTLHDGTVYAAGYGRRVVAVDVDAPRGRTRWARRVTGAILGGVVVGDGTVYLATARPDGKVHALDARTGRTRWRRTAPDDIGQPLALGAGLVVGHTQAGILFALDRDSGTVRWHRRIGPGRAPAVVLDSATVLATTMDSLYRLSAADGRIRTRAASPGTVLAGWVQAGGALVAGTTDSIVAVVDPATLAVRHRVRVDAPVETRAVVRGDTAWVATRLGTLYRVDLVAGVAEPVAGLRWPLTAGPVPYGDLLLLGGADGTLRAVDGAGAQRWRLAVWRPLDVPPVALDDGIVVVGGDGDLHRYGRE